MMTAMPDTSIRVDQLPSGQPVRITDRYEVVRTSGQSAWRPAAAPPTGPLPPPTGQALLVPPTGPLPSPVQGTPGEVKFLPTPVQAASKEPEGSGRALAVCLVLYFAAATLPVLSAIHLLTEESFAFWVGPFYPELLLVCVIGIALVMVATFSATGRLAPAYLQTRNCMVTMVSIFAGMLGVTLILIALPQSRAIYDVANRIGHGCQNSLPDSNMLVDVDTVLYNIKASPQCQAHESVEDCPGWSSNRYTRYIQYMEDEFNCGPLCEDMDVPFAAAPAPAAASLLATDSHHGKVRTEKLFTEGYARTHCFTEVAARMQELAWCYSDRMFWEGMGLLFVSLLTSMFFFLYQCTSKPPKAGSY